ncbi:hypothetical protein BC940DRAFT_292000 [Gongronella butleri]|nr:hypothetical protein BC940DRAFT_292000 [Gongronella butleri]
MSDTDKPKTPTLPVSDNQEQVSPTETDVNPPVAQETKVSVELPPGVVTLKEAFPTIDVDVVTAVLDSHQGNVEAAFDELLQLTDPAYQASQVPPAAPPRPAQTAPADDNADTPAMPPRPAPLSPEEQMRLDEEFARQLALEDERDRVRAHRKAKSNHSGGGRGRIGLENGQISKKHTTWSCSYFCCFFFLSTQN